MDQAIVTLGSNRYLNKANDTYPGAESAEQTYPGLAGKIVTLTKEEAEALTDITVTDYTSSTKLLAGRYQYVKVAAALTITPARGLAAWWDPTVNNETFTVDSDAPTTNSLLAGFFINAPTAGKYCWIALDRAYAKGKASSLTDAAAVGQILTVVAAAGTVDNPAASVTGYTIIAEEAAVAGTLKKVRLATVGNNVVGHF